MPEQLDYQCPQCGSWYIRGDVCNICGTIRTKIQKVMKVLSIQQPWAWAICNAGKDIENRNWPTNFRGEFLIHAGKKYDPDGYEFLREFDIIPPSYEIHFGGIVGKATLVNCVTKHNSKWFFGPYGFVLANRKPLDFIPLKGQLGFFEYKKLSKEEEIELRKK